MPNAESDAQGLVYSCLLDGEGGARPIGWAEVEAWTQEDGPLWIHLDRADPRAEAWLRERSGLDTYVNDGLLAEETRPRCDWYGDGILLILRGVNLNPGAEPEDMVSIRICLEEGRVISTRLRRLMAVDDIREQLAAGKGPLTPAHLVARLSAKLTDRIGPVIEDLSDEVAELEDAMTADDGDRRPDPGTNPRALRQRLIALRRTAISLRRYIAPQRDALHRLSQIEETWLDDRVSGRLRETVDRVTRITEALDEMRERAAVVQEEMASRAAARMERTMYVLTIVATIMLPLGFLTGLLGINVGGLPGAETPWAFWAVTVGLTALVVVEVWLFRRLRWL
jgi:zinc transporter